LFNSHVDTLQGLNVQVAHNNAARPWEAGGALPISEVSPMSIPKLSPDSDDATGPTPSFVVDMGGRRQVQLSRTKAGFYELALAGPTKPGSAWGDRLVVHGKLQLSAERVLETLLAIAEICRMVDEQGLPS
jgi:hypothetical protein